ncbi:MAG: hypothetical protein FJ109_00640 [Deltaproteobacteria bacterium]|nr:hypothetical protein [Deltaproteobacteria bacterium]
MHSRLALWIRLFLFPLFGRVGIAPHWADRVRESQEAGPVVHVLAVEGLLDLALFNYLFLKNRLRLARVTNSKLSNLLRPLVVLIFFPLLLLFRLASRGDPMAGMQKALAAGEPCLLFLKRARFVMMPGGNIGLPWLTELVRLQPTLPRPVMLVPHVLFWTKGPEKYRRNLVDLFLGDPNAPGLRKLLTFVAFPGRAHVSCGDPVNLAQALAESTQVGEDAAARKVSWLLFRAFDRVEKVTRGPMLKDAAQVRNEMVVNPDFVAGVTEAGQAMGLSEKAAMKRAARNITEIAADFRESAIEFLSFVLTPIFKRVFSGFVVDVKAMETIREASADSAVVLVPCHRSHIDYLVISYLMYLLGLNPPHIAAGANLTFFPMGPIFRRSGAFFIRRKIGDDRIYSFVLAQYVRKLLKDGHSLEFFIEGGRSRTGKTLPPKFGLLNYVAEAVTGEAVRDVVIIPLSLSYERIMEVEGYAEELAGREKRKEDALVLVKSAEVLDSRYGRLYLTAGRPIRMAEFLQQTSGKSPKELTEEEKRYLVKRLGYLILSQINRATVVNPTGLVAMVLLSHLRRGISSDRFQEHAGFLLDFAIKRGYPISITLDRALKAAIHDIARSREKAREGDDRLPFRTMGQAIAPALQETIEMFSAQRHLRIEEFAGGPVYAVRPRSRTYLNYYRNNIIHVYQREALVAISLYARTCQREIRVAEVEEDVRFFSRLFKKEFIFRQGDFERGIAAGLEAFALQGTVILSGDEVVPVPASVDRLAIFRNMLLPIVESYWVCARYASMVRFQGAMKSKDLVKAILDRAHRDYQEGEITCQESLSTVSVLNALERYLDMDLLMTAESGVDAGKIRLARGSSFEELEELAERLRFFVTVA